jgi:DNA-directed RNA polymerase subunit M/transcription elongation factor TFIIS
MHAHETQPATPQSHTSAPKANPFAPLAFETAGFEQEKVDVASNPFARRPYDVDMGPTVARKPAEPTTQLEPEATLGNSGWSQFNFYAPDRPQEEAGDQESSNPEAASGKVQAKAIDSQPAPAASQPAFAPSLPSRPTPWMWQPALPQPASQEAQPEAEIQPSESNWLKFDLYAAGQTPPNPPRGVGVQAKVTIGQPDDGYEQEADRVAEQVMSIAPPAMPNVQRQTEAEVQTKCEACEEEESIQRTVNEASQIIEAENQLIAIQRRVRGPHGWGLAGGPFIPIGIACWLRSGTYNDRFADDVLRRIEYDEETRQWNVNEGRDEGDWAQAMFDAWGHCYIAACLGRRVPEHETSAAGTFYEILHEAFSHATHGIIEHDSLTQDLYNQAVGRDIGLHQPDGDLYEICFNAMMQGRLDLTLAGVARGRALVPRAGGSTGTRVQRKETDTSVVGETNLESRLNQSKGGGRPLPDEVRSFMEPRFGTDFSQVRVHTGAEAVQMNRAVGAKAFAHQQDIYYGAGESPRKDELTAHELTHVVQQTGKVQNKLQPVTFQALPHLAREFDQQPITERQTDNKALPTVQMKCAACEGEEEKIQPKQIGSNKALPTVQMKCAACGGEEEKIQPKSIASTVTAVTAHPNKTLQKLPSWDDVKNTASSGAQWVGDTASSGAQWVGDKAGQVADMGKDAFASLVARVAPGLSDLIRQGPVGLLTEKIKDGLKGWLSGVVSGANIGDVVATLKGSFAQVFAGVQGLGKGDPASCAAFADSVQKLRDLGQAFMDNPVVKQVQAAFTKVSGVFQKVTSAIVAPVFDTLMNVAGGVFSAVKGFATTIWEWGAPVRNTLGAAWDWVKEQLGIGGDGSEGILGWLKTKASDAWASIKTTFAPVIEPLKKVGLVLLAFSPVGLFAAIAKFGPKLLQMAEWLWAHKGDKDIVKNAHKEMGGTILPGLLSAVQSFSQVIQSTVTSLVNQVTQLSQSVLGLLGAISGVPLLSMAQSLVQGLSEKLQQLVTWGQDTFEAVAKSVQETFAKIKTRLNPISVC